MHTSDTWLARAFAVSALLIVAWCLADYSINWMHPERYYWEKRNWLDQTHLYWSDIGRFFDCAYVTENCTRSRFLSYLIGYVDMYFRVWLFEFIPPHPTVSLSWLFSFGALYFFYRSVVELTQDRFTALLGVGLYALSAGFLSLFLLLFHPAKPLASFFAMFCTYLSIRIWQSPDSPAVGKTVALCGSMFLAFFADETAWVLWIIVPMFCPNPLDRRYWWRLACILATFPVFLGLLTWPIPEIVRHVVGRDFLFWSWAFNVGRATPSLLERIQPDALMTEAREMVVSQFSWWRLGPAVADVSLAAVGTALAWAIVVAQPARRALIFRMLMIFGTFLIFQCFILLRHRTGSGTFYYGALFSNFSLLLVCTAIASVSHRRTARMLSLGAAVYLAFISFTWFMEQNRNQMALHNRAYAIDFVSDLGPLDLNAELTAGKVIQYWQAVKAGDDVRSWYPRFAPKDAWLFSLADVTRRRNQKN
jgi:hypothetical protein